MIYNDYVGNQLPDAKAKGSPLKPFRLGLCLLIFILPQLSFPFQTELTGYAKLRYNWDEGSNPQTSFSLQDVRLMNKITISKISSLVAELNTTSSVVVKSCYIQLKLREGTLMFGQFKIPFGYEIPLPAALLETPTIATVLSKLFPNQTYDQGLKWTPNKHLQMALLNGTGENTKDNDNAKDVLLHLSNGNRGISYGASLYIGKQKIGNAQKSDEVAKNRWGLDLLLNEGKSVITSEVIWGRDGEEDSRGWYVKYRYNQGSTSYILKYQYYDGVNTFDPTKWKWQRMEEKAFIFGPMFYLDKNTILSLMFTSKQGEKNDQLVLQLEVIY